MLQSTMYTLDSGCRPFWLQELQRDHLRRSEKGLRLLPLGSLPQNDWKEHCSGLKQTQQAEKQVLLA